MSKILIVDDNPSVLRSLEFVLLNEGHTVALASSAHAGLEIAAREKIDILLLDVDMPRMSGIDVCRKLQSDPALRHLPVLIMTGRGSDEVVARAKSAGARGVLSKPFDLKELNEAIAQNLAHIVDLPAEPPTEL
jgi:two-component system cell cycle response regulator